MSIIIHSDEERPTVCDKQSIKSPEKEVIIDLPNISTKPEFISISNEAELSGVLIQKQNTSIIVPRVPRTERVMIVSSQVIQFEENLDYQKEEIITTTALDLYRLPHIYPKKKQISVNDIDFIVEN